MTAEQVKLLKRFAREVVLMLDADPAGRAATMKVVHLFVEAELPCRIAQLRAKDGKKQDPDELARKNLPKLEALIENAQDAVEFYFEQVASTSPPSIPGKVAAVEECTSLLRAVRYSRARDFYVDRLASLVNIDTGAIRRSMRGSGIQIPNKWLPPLHPVQRPLPILHPLC